MALNRFSTIHNGFRKKFQFSNFTNAISCNFSVHDQINFSMFSFTQFSAISVLDHINIKSFNFCAIYCNFRSTTTSILNKFQFFTQFTANVLDHTMNKNPIRYHGGLARATKFDLYFRRRDTPNVHQTIFSINSFFNKIVYSDF